MGQVEKCATTGEPDLGAEPSGSSVLTVLRMWADRLGALPPACDPRLAQKRIGQHLYRRTLASARCSRTSHTRSVVAMNVKSRDSGWLK